MGEQFLITGAISPSCAACHGSPMRIVTRWAAFIVAGPAALVAAALLDGFIVSARNHQYVHHLTTWLIPAALLAACGLLVVLARRA